MDPAECIRQSSLQSDCCPDDIQANLDLAHREDGSPKGGPDSAAHSDAGPDSAAHSDAGPDSAAHSDAGPDSTAHSDAGPDSTAHSDAGPDSAAHSDADPDSAAHSDADPDSAAHSDAGSARWAREVMALLLRRCLHSALRVSPVRPSPDCQRFSQRWSSQQRRQRFRQLRYPRKPRILGPAQQHKAGTSTPP